MTLNTIKKLKIAKLSEDIQELMQKHEHMLSIMHKLPGDYVPWGEVERWEDPARPYPDCSCGCKFACWLDGDLASDWCVCTNPGSHRVGLLTFEHQGCEQFEAEQDEDDDA